MLEFQEEAFDQIALAVEREVAVDLRRCCSGRDHRDGVLFGDGITQRFCIIALVAEDVFCRQTFDQGFGLRDVAGLPWRKNETQRVAQRVDDGMDFCGQATARTTDRASFRPLFLPAAC